MDKREADAHLRYWANGGPRATVDGAYRLLQAALRDLCPSGMGHVLTAEDESAKTRLVLTYHDTAIIWRLESQDHVQAVLWAPARQHLVSVSVNCTLAGNDPWFTHVRDWHFTEPTRQSGDILAFHTETDGGDEPDENPKTVTEQATIWGLAHSAGWPVVDPA